MRWMGLMKWYQFPSVTSIVNKRTARSEGPTSSVTLDNPPGGVTAHFGNHCFTVRAAISLVANFSELKEAPGQRWNPHRNRCYEDILAGHPSCTRQGSTKNDCGSSGWDFCLRAREVWPGLTILQSWAASAPAITYPQYISVRKVKKLSA
jgi:hypothetical protein